MTSSLVADVIQAEIGAKERWPEDAKLFEPYQAEQIILPDYANCLSVRTFLKMCKLPFSRDLRINAEEMSPSGKLPFIKVGAFIVAEFEPVVALVNTRGFQLTADLSDSERSDLRAYSTMVATVFGNTEEYLSWKVDPILTQVTKPRYGSVHPWPLNWVLPLFKHCEVNSKLKGAGWANKTLSEVKDKVQACCQALSERLENKQYFFGESPTELDALVFGHLFSLLTIELPCVDFGSIIKQFVNLTEFCKRIEEKYYKEEGDE